jgi:hypothetical protein
MTDAEQGTIVVAVVGIAATAATAIVGLLVQIVLAGATARREQRRKRYDELLAVYSESGRSMSAYTYAYAQLLVRGAKGKVKTADGAAMDKRIEEDARKFESRHFGGMLRLHNAHPAVIDGLKAWQAIINEDAPSLLDDALFAWWEGQRERLEAALRRYYELAGIHARSQLRTWPIRSLISTRLRSGAIPKAAS